MNASRRGARRRAPPSSTSRTWTSSGTKRTARVGGAAGARGDAGAARVTAASSAALYANVTSPDASVAGGEGGGVFAAADPRRLRARLPVRGERSMDDAGAGGARLSRVAASLFAFGAGSRFERNVARAGSGGGVSHEGLALALLGPNVVFEENRALDGGAVAVVIEPATAALVASRASFFFEALLAYVPEERECPTSPSPSPAPTCAATPPGGAAAACTSPRALAHGAARAAHRARRAGGRRRGRLLDERLRVPRCRARVRGVQGAGRRVRGRRARRRRRRPLGGALASLSGEMIGVATEALEVSFAGGVALPAELASAASAPAFAASLVDFYGRVAATENGVACRIEPAAVPRRAIPRRAPRRRTPPSPTRSSSAARWRLPRKGARRVRRGRPRGRLGSTYEARIACADRARFLARRRRFSKRRFSKTRRETPPTPKTSPPSRR